MSLRNTQSPPRTTPFRSGIVLVVYAACCGNASTLLGSVEITDADTGVAKVVIVRSKELDPFRQAEESYISSLPSSIGAQSYSLTQATPEMLAQAASDPNTAFFAIGSEAASSVKAAIPATSMLTCAMMSDPTAVGVFDGRATTVISMDCPHAAQISFISSALPNVRRIGVLYRGDTAKGNRAVEGMRAALPPEWAIEAIAVEKEASISEAITRMFNAKVDLVWTYPESSLYDTATIKTLLLESVRQRVPVFGFSPAFVRAGATIGVGTTPADQGRQAAGTLNSTKGTQGDGDDLIVPPDMNTYINTAVAEQLGVELPASVINAATNVFK